MRTPQLSTPYPWMVAAILAPMALLMPSAWDPTFVRPAVRTGWFLFGLMAFLGVLNVRKKLSMLPLVRVSTWYTFHIILGLLSVLFFWSHARTLWPSGLYEQLLAVLVYLVILTGIVGAVLQKVYPTYLARSGVEVIYERIPAELAHLRAQAVQTVEACTEKTGSPTLARYYIENFVWFFEKPRFQIGHVLMLNDGKHWVQLNTRVVRRYLNDREQEYLDRLYRLALHKNDLDSHHAIQGVLKKWLMVHIPLALAMMLLATWHVLLIHVYVL